MHIPYLSETELAALGIRTADVITAIEEAIRGVHSGRVWSAPKAVILPGDGRYMMAALAAMDEPSYLTVKTVVLNPDNPEQGLAQINGLVTMLDSKTGLPVAILDGNWITAVRTAGLSAVAAKYLANPASTSVGFVGCGVQARSHLQAFSEMFPLTRIQYFGRGEVNKTRLAQCAQALGLTAQECESGQAAIEGVDLVVTSITPTGNPPPFLDAKTMQAGVFAALTDLGVPWHSESFAAMDTVIIDDVAQEATQERKLCRPQDIDGDLAGLVLGQAASRARAAQRCAFLFRGHALGDLALSVLALSRYSQEHPQS